MLQSGHSFAAQHFEVRALSCRSPLRSIFAFSLSMHRSDRPLAAIRHDISMLRMQPALRTLAACALSGVNPNDSLPTKLLFEYCLI